MSIFKTQDCPICNAPTGAMSKSSAKYNNLFVCQDCAKKLTAKGFFLMKLKRYSLEELQKAVGASTLKKEEHLAEISAFHATKTVGNYIHFDDVNKKFAIPRTTLTGAVKDLQIYNYSDVIDYELLEDGNSVSKGGVGRAIVGGVLFGHVGAIVGGNTGHKLKGTCSKLQIKITLSNMDNPTVYINFIEMETKKDGFIYKQAYPMAQETLSLLNIIGQANANTEAEPARESSSADEILKYKNLLDSGIITQEEFDAKKKQLLGL